MQQNTSRIARDQLLAVLQEAFEGPRQSWSYFTDPGPTSGFLGTVEALSAEEVSRPFGPSGNTIAAHAYHAAFGLAVSSAWIGGDRTPPNWRDSWKLKTVDDATWAKLRDQLQREYEDLTRVIESIDLSNPEALGGAVGAIAHTAYHLGAIRQGLVPVTAS